MISKQLFQEVIGFEVGLIYMTEIPSSKSNVLTYEVNKKTNTINIHELENNCKKWAWELGFDIVQSVDHIAVCQGSELVFELTFDVEFDPEYTFKACQWILDTKKEM